MRTVAALFVEAGGVYYEAAGVDPWPKARDARKYRGPHPVVAHPPCERWCMPLAKVNETRYGHKVGDDGGCFRSALAAVRRYGGVLEHPASTAAWKAFGLTKPIRGRWAPTPCGGWVCQVAQSAYGHRARKRTWLYAITLRRPPDLDWSEPAPTAVTSWLQKTTTKLPRITKTEACKTPIRFRNLLLSLARAPRPRSRRRSSAPTSKP